VRKDEPNVLCVTPPAEEAMFGNLSGTDEMQC
jgi:hypothetical protein